jgi:phosphotransacetylase
MERIVIQVDDETAKKWRLASQKKRNEISQEMNLRIAKGLANSKEDFLQYLDELGAKMKERGLTEEILQDILNNED